MVGTRTSEPNLIRAASRRWIAVASAEHVRRGRSAGFMQVCHGKGGPLARIKPGDLVAYYSPTTTFGGKDRLQAFTAIGIVRTGGPYVADTDDAFRPSRRDVAWADACEAPIGPLLSALEFTAGRDNWGRRFRFGLFSVSACDFQLIATAMNADFAAIEGAASPALNAAA